MVSKPDGDAKQRCQVILEAAFGDLEVDKNQPDGMQDLLRIAERVLTTFETIFRRDHTLIDLTKLYRRSPLLDSS